MIRPIMMRMKLIRETREVRHVPALLDPDATVPSKDIIENTDPRIIIKRAVSVLLAMTLPPTHYRFIE
jgi:hypothetical protein